MNNLLSFIPAVFELFGLFLIGNKLKVGFLFNIAGGILWILYALYTKSAYGLILVCSIATILNIKGYDKWKRK